MGKFHWFNIMRYTNAVIQWVAVFAFIAWWWFPWAIYVTIGGVASQLLVIAMVVFPIRLCKKSIFPRWMEYLAFEAYRFKVNSISKKTSALISYPFAIFSELELPSIFWEKGLAAAIQATKDWAKNLDEKLKNEKKNDSVSILPSPYMMAPLSDSLQNAVDRAFDKPDEATE